MLRLSLLALVLATPALAQDFPVTLVHEMGETTIAARPERVVSIGMHEQDMLYALGIAPVGVHEWWGEQPHATWPWAEDERAALGATPEVLTGWEINIEWVAAQEPDLIVATYYSDLTADEYAMLSAIAPVITAPPGYDAWGQPWQEEMRLIGRATGTAARAEEIVTGIEAQFAAVRAEYPQLAGASAAVVYFFDGQPLTYHTGDVSHRFLAQLGLVVPPDFDAMADESGTITLSVEDLSPIDLDVVMFPEEPVADGPLSQVPTYGALRLAAEGRAVNLGGGDLSAAFAFQTPLALGWLLEVLPPMLAQAADGDPATPVTLPDL